jgi:hypothetical protein
MKKMILFFGIFVSAFNSFSQIIKPISKVEEISIEYEGKKVKAKQLTVSSEIPMDLDNAWANVKTPALLQFVAKGMISFKSIDNDLPKQWEIGKAYQVKMKVFGFIPFGGIHHLFIEKIEDSSTTISTKEWDKAAKIWNHNVIIKDLGNGKIYYEDAITIYGGILTGFITSFAKRFYIHRQKRWQIVAKENLKF